MEFLLTASNIWFYFKISFIAMIVAWTHFVFNSWITKWYTNSCVAEQSNWKKFTYTLSTTDFVMSHRTTLPFVQPVASKLLESNVAVQLNSLFVKTYSWKRNYMSVWALVDSFTSDEKIFSWANFSQANSELSEREQNISIFVWFDWMWSNISIDWGLYLLLQVGIYWNLMSTIYGLTTTQYVQRNESKIQNNHLYMKAKDRMLVRRWDFFFSI